MSERTVIDIIFANNEVFRIAQTIGNSSKPIMWLLSKVLNVKKNSIKTAAVVLTRDLGNLLGKELDLRVIWDYPTIASLAQHLSE
ncbi:acyl carrier protein [Nostoc sp.]|uniref:acyl carrier protein n=1 Tax=Nostoc sp. TaxID=1180 RepID=UPI002FF6F1D3